MFQAPWKFCVLILLFCISCNEAVKNDQPILTKAEMVEVLKEIYLTEQKVNRLGLPRDSAEYEFERFKRIVFEKKGVSDSVFKRSFNYYMDRPKEMEMIYTALVDSLSLLEQRIDSPVKK
jgi:hypothetical protein